MAKSTNGGSVEIMKIEPAKIAEIETLKTEVLEVVKAHPFIQIKDSKTFKAAIESRKALRDISLKVEKQDGAIATFMIGVRKSIGQFLIGEKGINKLSRLPYDKQDVEVKRWETIQQQLKDEQEAADKEEREKQIAEIGEIVDGIKTFIESTVYETIEKNVNQLLKMISERKGTFGIYDVYFDPHVDGFYSAMKTKVNSLEQENEQAETNRKNGISGHIGEIETAVKNLILGATFETIDETTNQIVEIMTTEYDFQEFESAFETKSDELHALWKTTQQTLSDAKELADLRAENLFNKRSAILLEIGMEKRENDDFFVNDLDYSKATILADTDEHFNRTVENIKRFIAGENAKPNVQIIEDDQPAPTVESIDRNETHMEDAATFAIEHVKSNDKPDFVAMAEQKLQGDQSQMGGENAFKAATHMLEDANEINVQLDAPGIAKTVGELMDLLSIMNPEVELVGPLQVVVEGGKVTIDYFS